MTTPTPPPPDPVEVVARAMEAHHLVTGVVDADRNSPCACRGWREGGDETWDEHMAEVALTALADRPPNGFERFNALAHLRAALAAAERTRSPMVPMEVGLLKVLADLLIGEWREVGSDE